MIIGGLAYLFFTINLFFTHALYIQLLNQQIVIELEIVPGEEK